MIISTTGDILKSNADALVNTVNCEGYMGKGIAYQFKLQYPGNNEDYVRACKIGELQIGKLHYFKEDGKLIINFPTKNKWRAKSKMEYVEKGLDELVKLIEQLGIHSIAIPSLGSGNGGLIWQDVKKLIEDKLSAVNNNVQIFLYEPSNKNVLQPKPEPKLNLSALVLMNIKQYLTKFDMLRLQKTAFYMECLSGQQYFNFSRQKSSPSDNAINNISRNIKEFQKYHGVKSTEEAYEILYNKLISKHVETNLATLLPFIKKAATFVNNIETNHELESVSTLAYLIHEKKQITQAEIIHEFNSRSEDKANRFTEAEIINGIDRLYDAHIIEKTLMGYTPKHINVHSKMG